MVTSIFIQKREKLQTVITYYMLFTKLERTFKGMKATLTFLVKVVTVIVSWKGHYAL